MVKILSIAFCMLQLSYGYGQILENDTVFVKRSVHTETTEIDTIIIRGGISPVQQQVLVSTTFLPSTQKMIGLLNNGLSPISLELIESCNNTTDPGAFKDYPKFISTLREENTLIIDVSIIANCCHNFLGEAEIVGKDTLNLVYTSYGGFCSCECHFTLRYKFDTAMEEEYQVLRYVTINGNPKVGEIVKRH